MISPMRNGRKHSSQGQLARAVAKAQSQPKVGQGGCAGGAVQCAGAAKRLDTQTGGGAQVAGGRPRWRAAPNARYSPAGLPPTTPQVAGAALVLLILAGTLLLYSLPQVGRPCCDSLRPGSSGSGAWVRKKRVGSCAFAASSASCKQRPHPQFLTLHLPSCAVWGRCGRRRQPAGAADGN